MQNRHSHIIFMKAGPYCGFDLDEIIEIKQNEEKACGKFFWGYGGVFCHPKRVLPFIQLALSQGTQPVLLFTITASKFSSSIGQAKEYSADKKMWQPLPKEVLLVGNEYALVGNNLRGINLTLDLSEYRSMLGEKRGKSLDEYIRYRIDKSCAVYDPNLSRTPREVTISYISELVPPYCVFVRPEIKGVVGPHQLSFKF